MVASTPSPTKEEKGTQMPTTSPRRTTLTDAGRVLALGPALLAAALTMLLAGLAPSASAFTFPSGAGAAGEVQLREGTLLVAAREARVAPVGRLGHGALTRLTRRLGDAVAVVCGVTGREGRLLDHDDRGRSGHLDVPGQQEGRCLLLGVPEGLLVLPSRRARRVRRPAAGHGVAVVRR